MRLLSAIFDAAMLPADMTIDTLDFLCHSMGSKSRTRQRIEDVEDNLRW